MELTASILPVEGLKVAPEVANVMDTVLVNTRSLAAFVFMLMRPPKAGSPTSIVLPCQTTDADSVLARTTSPPAFSDSAIPALLGMVNAAEATFIPKAAVLRSTAPVANTEEVEKFRFKLAGRLKFKPVPKFRLTEAVDRTTKPSVFPLVSNGWPGGIARGMSLANSNRTEAVLLITNPSENAEFVEKAILEFAGSWSSALVPMGIFAEVVDLMTVAPPESALVEIVMGIPAGTPKSAEFESSSFAAIWDRI